MFEFNYKLIKEDYIEFNIFHSKNSKTMMKSINLSRLMLPIIFMIFAIITGEVTNPIPMVIFITISILWVAFLPMYMWYIIKKKAYKIIEEDKNGDLFAVKNIKIDKSGIHLKSENTLCTYNWGSIIKICDTEIAVYIYVSSIQAIVIPKRLSEDDINIDELINYCYSMVEI